MAGERVRRFSVATRDWRGTRLTSRPSAAGARGARRASLGQACGEVIFFRCPDVENSTRESSCLISARMQTRRVRLGCAVAWAALYERSHAVRWWRATYLRSEEHTSELQ